MNTKIGLLKNKLYIKVLFAAVLMLSIIGIAYTVQALNYFTPNANIYCITAGAPFDSSANYQAQGGGQVQNGQVSRTMAW